MGNLVCVKEHLSGNEPPQCGGSFANPLSFFPQKTVWIEQGALWPPALSSYSTVTSTRNALSLQSNRTYLASEVTLDNSTVLKKVPQNDCLLDPDKYSTLLVKVSLWEYAFYHLVTHKAKSLASFWVNYVLDSDFVSATVKLSPILQ